MTKDPTSCYMFVMKYYEGGNLYSFLDLSRGILCWSDILDILWGISSGLEVIHEEGLVHGNLHGGNILIESEDRCITLDGKISDTGLHGPIDKSSQQIYGVIPFIAPEIFNGSIPSKASDIYSFGIIMCMLSSELRPYHDRPHDSQLICEIISGSRPKPIYGTPPVFSKLMAECLDANPSNRPTADRLNECFGSWVASICDSERSELSLQFDEAELVKFKQYEKL